MVLDEGFAAESPRLRLPHGGRTRRWRSGRSPSQRPTGRC